MKEKIEKDKNGEVGGSRTNIEMEDRRFKKNGKVWSRVFMTETSLSNGEASNHVNSVTNNPEHKTKVVEKWKKGINQIKKDGFKKAINKNSTKNRTKRMNSRNTRQPHNTENALFDDTEEKLKQQWYVIVTTFDRFFLFIYTTLNIVATLLIFVILPILSPTDVKPYVVF